VRQVVLSAGKVQIVEVPAPSPSPGRVLVANVASVISSGTERAATTSGGGSGPLPVRALRNPELARRAIAHMREHGLRPTLDLARGVTAPYATLGYSSAGLVVDSGGVTDFRGGQMVACAGSGYANHAEVVSVPANLVAPVPAGIDGRVAAFTTLGAIALQGVRRATPALGERIVVAGLGLLGLITVQLLIAAGCEVVGTEPSAERRALAVELGAHQAVAPEEVEQTVAAWSAGAGADACIITAASSEDTVVNQAVLLVRRKGRVVAVGDVGLGLQRSPLYSREADVLISTSYGPGRYDPTYEEAGIDYPFAYVRWTENRNMREFLRLLYRGQVTPERLIELERPLSDAAEAYAAVSSPAPPLAAILTYDSPSAARPGEVVRVSRAVTGRTPASSDQIGTALIGAGGFVRSVHLPNLIADGRARVVVIANQSGTSAADAARLAHGADTTTDWATAVRRNDVDLVVIGTRHDTHAEIAVTALGAGKAVLLEKPLGLTRAEIDSVWRAAVDNDRFAIGFNRPFAPLAQQLAEELPASPRQVVYRVCAPLAPDHWLNDSDVGGGRILGEVCHMFDFTNWLCGAPVSVCGLALPAVAGVRSPESSSVSIQYEDGSVATVHYSAAGPATLPKERIEVLCGGRAWVLDDFEVLSSFDSHSRRRAGGQARVDKGHRTLMTRVLDACRGQRPFEPGIGAAYAAQSVALAALEAITALQCVNVRLAPEGAHAGVGRESAEHNHDRA
jgi:polar amino acid transport system substrate-binding protein